LHAAAFVDVSAFRDPELGRFSGRTATWPLLCHISLVIGEFRTDPLAAFSRHGRELTDSVRGGREYDPVVAANVPAAATLRRSCASTSFTTCLLKPGAAQRRGMGCYLVSHLVGGVFCWSARSRPNLAGSGAAFVRGRA